MEFYQQPTKKVDVYAAANTVHSHKCDEERRRQLLMCMYRRLFFPVFPFLFFFILRKTKSTQTMYVAEHIPTNGTKQGGRKDTITCISRFFFFFFQSGNLYIPCKRQNNTVGEAGKGDGGGEHTRTLRHLIVRMVSQWH